ncbi:MAG TPA: hypothetical protein VER33_16535 [Polyangiaceae bacterium]|nr:hypothetical protein [Polyangiaceae bacterium]
MLVYRDTKRQLSAGALIADLRQALGEGVRDTLALLLQAAELECGLADAGSAALPQAVRCTERLALAWLSGELPDGNAILQELEHIDPATWLSLTRPEGYAYYALDPRGYVQIALEQLAADSRPVAVLGIRSIGSSLSAVVQATGVSRGRSSGRLTVRPTGHPWDRRLRFSDEERSWVELRAAEHQFWVVDEGPGMSGSTLLAVGEALLELVADGRVTFFCSHPPDRGKLVAPDAERRWSRFAARSVAAWEPPPGATNLAGGGWRTLVYAGSEQWPACWPQHERVKYRSSDARSVVKFIGFPPYDRQVRLRADVLAQAGYSPRLETAEPGFIRYDWQPRIVGNRSARQLAIPELADYVAFRARSLPSSAASVSELETLLHVNVAEELGVDLPSSFKLELCTPVQPDARMLPHEWLLPASNGPLLKLDASDHADDHLFPGACDSAWDLAGACVEWDLDRDESAALLRRYHQATGDDARSRVDVYVLAYCAFRLGYARFAEGSVDAAEGQRWRTLRLHYRNHLQQTLARLGNSP